jgi:hypothetical protein
MKAGIYCTQDPKFLTVMKAGIYCTQTPNITVKNFGS